MKSPIPIEMFFHREKGASTLQARLVSSIVQAILDTRARPGTPMPSTRELARELAISRMTVTLVYQELVGLGYIETVPRSGVIVAETVPHRRRGGFRPARTRFWSHWAPRMRFTWPSNCWPAPTG